MKTLPMYCGRCKALIRVPLPESSTAYVCEHCGAEIEAHVFPALLKNPADGRSPEELIDPDDAGCFYHPTKKAEVHCESCGRFLCALCHVEFEKWQMCPQCVEQGVRTGRLGLLRTSMALYNKIVRYSIIPFLAPYALYLFIRHRNDPVAVRIDVRFREIKFVMFCVAQTLWCLVGVAGLLIKVIGGIE